MASMIFRKKSLDVNYRWGKMCYFEVTVEQMGIHFELKTLKEMSFHHDYFKTALEEQKS